LRRTPFIISILIILLFLGNLAYVISSKNENIEFLGVGKANLSFLLQNQTSTSTETVASTSQTSQTQTSTQISQTQQTQTQTSYTIVYFNNTKGCKGYKFVVDGDGSLPKPANYSSIYNNFSSEDYVKLALIDGEGVVSSRMAESSFTQHAYAQHNFFIHLPFQINNSITLELFYTGWIEGFKPEGYVEVLNVKTGQHIRLFTLNQTDVLYHTTLDPNLVIDKNNNIYVRVWAVSTRGLGSLATIKLTSDFIALIAYKGTPQMSFLTFQTRNNLIYIDTSWFIVLGAAFGLMIYSLKPEKKKKWRGKR